MQFSLARASSVPLYLTRLGSLVDEVPDQHQVIRARLVLSRLEDRHQLIEAPVDVSNNYDPTKCWHVQRLDKIQRVSNKLAQ